MRHLLYQCSPNSVQILEKQTQSNMTQYKHSKNKGGYINQAIYDLN